MEFVNCKHRVEPEEEVSMRIVRKEAAYVTPHRRWLLDDLAAEIKQRLNIEVEPEMIGALPIPEGVDRRLYAVDAKNFIILCTATEAGELTIELMRLR